MTLLSDHDMSCGPELRRRLDVLQTRALVAGGAGLALALGGWVLWPRQIFAAYLVGYLFWLGIVLGSLGLAMLHHLVGGSWGLVIRRPLEAGAATVPLMALLFVPVALGMPTLYPWARAGAAEHVGAHLREAYLNEPYFLARAAGYFGVWTALGFMLAGWSSRQDRTGDHRPSGRLHA